MLGRTKDQIRTTEQVNAALKACTDLKLDSLVIIGGTYFSSFSGVCFSRCFVLNLCKYDFLSSSQNFLNQCFYLLGVTSNTDAAHLAEFFAEAKCSTKVLISSQFFSFFVWSCIMNHFSDICTSPDIANSRNYQYVSGSWCSGHY